MLRTTGIRCDIRQVDLGLLAGAQFDFGAFCGFFKALQRQWVIAQVEALVFLELVNQVIHDPLVKIFTAEEGVTIGRQHFELELTVNIRNLDDGNIKGSATQIINCDHAVTGFLVHTIGQCSGGRLVNDALDRQARDPTGILGCLTL